MVAVNLSFWTKIRHSVATLVLQLVMSFYFIGMFGTAPSATPLTSPHYPSTSSAHMTTTLQ
jgi:hypothetical protein